MRPSLKVSGARRVDAEDGDLVVDERRLEVGLDEAAVLAERAEEALPDAVQRHVVVARHHDLRRAAAGRGRRALPRTARLRARWVRSPETATRSGVASATAREQRLDQRGVDAPEVKVGEVDEGAHRVSSQAGASVRAASRPGSRGGCGSAAAAASRSLRRRWRRAGACAVLAARRSSVAGIASKSRAWRRRPMRARSASRSRRDAAGPLRRRRG